MGLLLVDQSGQNCVDSQLFAFGHRLDSRWGGGGGL